MRKITFRPFLAAISFIPFWASCAPASPEVQDLRLIKVEIVPQHQIPASDKYWDPGAITSPLVKVWFSSKENLEQLAKLHGYNIDSVTSLCNGEVLDRNRRLRGFPSVFDAFGRIDTFRTTASSAPPRSTGGTYLYHLYFEPRMAGVSGFYSYDLVSNPSDVCITVNGAEEVGFVMGNTFVSNALILPRQVIEKAVATAQKKGVLR